MTHDDYGLHYPGAGTPRGAHPLTSRERLSTVLRGQIPDRVPVAPDFSTMTPARMTGKPFPDRYRRHDPPIWFAPGEGIRPVDLGVASSGTPIYQTPELVRQDALPAVKRASKLATAAVLPTHRHSCDRERELVRLLTAETTLALMDPLHDRDGADG